MKDYLRYMIILILFTFLCNGFVSADSEIASGDKSVNDTIKIESSLVSALSEKDQVKLADIKTTLSLEIQQSIIDQITFNESVTEAIAEKEEQLVRSPLIINDSYDITDEVQTFFVGNTTTSLEPTSLGSELLRENITSSAGILPVNQIPKGGFIEFGSDGKTRIFSSVGTQISYVIDDRSEKITTPSGKVLPSTHIIGIPNGAASHTRGNREYITMNGEVILTIVDQYSKDISGLSTVPSPRSSPWVEYAESDPYYIAAIHSNWVIPHSPNLDIPATTSNILFNGIEPSNGSMIFQPVTAFNYFAHSSIIGPGNRTDPAIVNRWTGSSWICPLDTSHCHRSNPVLSFSQGELAYGAVFWYEAPVSEWFVYLVNSSNQGTWQFSDPYDYTQPSRAVVVYEFGGSDPLGLLPNDNQKIANTTFSNISVWDTNGNQISSLHWNGIINTKDHKKITGLNVDLSQAPSTVTLETDYRGSKIGVFRNGLWVIDSNGNFAWDGGIDQSLNFGSAGDSLVYGDWNGNNRTKIGVFNNGSWLIDYNGNGVYDGPVIDRTASFGSPGQHPIVGDWNGDHNDEIGTEKDGFWALDYNGNFAWDGTVIDRFAAFGQADDNPVVGDWNGEGRTKIGSEKDGFWSVDYNGNYVWDYPLDKFAGFGQANDNPVVGDWNGDHKDKIGSQKDGFWAVDYNGNFVWDGEVTDRFAGLGQADDTPVTGDWNSDGSDEIGSFANGFWAIDYNGNYQWDGVGADRFAAFGLAGDLPVVGNW